MLHTGEYLLDQLLIPFVLMFFVVSGIVGVFVGVALIVSSARTLRFFGTINRWVSVRPSLRPLEEPHDIGKAVYEYRRWFGAAFAAGGAFAIFVLLARVDVAAVVSALNVNAAPVIVALVVASLRWILVVGGVLAVVIGIMLALSSDALRAVEARVNRWYTPKKLGEDADRMHLTLDKWVETFPRTAGWILASGALIVLVDSTIVWLGQR